MNSDDKTRRSPTVYLSETGRYEELAWLINFNHTSFNHTNFNHTKLKDDMLKNGIKRFVH